MSTNPIKRSKALMPFSREHHFDLLLAWKIRRGLANGTEAERIAAYICYLNEHLIKKHFQDEETLLFLPLIPRDELCIRALKEHQAIRKLAEEICSGQYHDAVRFNHFANTLEEHVRFEERELYPHLEEVISRERLSELKEIIAASHGDFTDIWEDEFWEKNKT